MQVVSLSVVASFIYYIVVLLLRGQDVNWDLLNYHYFASFALFQGWTDLLFAPSQRQTFFNPLLNAPVYPITTLAGPPALAALFLLLQSLAAVALAVLVKRMLSDVSVRVPIAGQVAIVLLCLSAPIALGELGGSQGDSTTATLVLGGLALALFAAPNNRFSFLIMAGALVGAAVGLKLTNAGFALGLLAAVLVMSSPRLRAKTLISVSVGLVAGALLTYGPWGWMLWRDTGNPFFPQFNHIFVSDLIDPSGYVDNDLKGGNWLEVMLYPFIHNTTFGPHDGRAFRDLRLPMVIAISLLAVFVAGLRRLRGGGPALPSSVLALATFWWVSYLAWLLVFSISRYAVVLEMLAPIIVIALAYSVFGMPGHSGVNSFHDKRGSPGRLTATHWLVGGGLVILVISGISGARSPDIFPRRAWSSDLFDVHLDAPNRYQGSLIVMTGFAPMSFVIPYFPATAEFVRVDGNLFTYSHLKYFHEDPRLRFAGGIGSHLCRKIGGSDRKLYVLSAREDLFGSRGVLEHFGIQVDFGACLPVNNGVGQTLDICSAVRQGQCP